MTNPLCRPCSIVHPELRTRTPNRATHATFFVDGLATLTCNTHTEMAIRAGGFALSLAELPWRFDVESSTHLGRKLTAAIVSTDARQRARDAVYEAELPIVDVLELPSP
jgi:hypothetical protein